MKEARALARLNRIDLNLLVILQDLLETTNTSQTATRLGRTQPAISQALGRLRLHFDDPLLIRHGPKLTPSPLAAALKEPLTLQLNGLAETLEGHRPFDPSTSERQVVLAGEDITTPQLIKLAQQLRKAAPGISVRFYRQAQNPTDIVLGHVDLSIILYPGQRPTGIEFRPLGKLPWVVIADRGHPISDRPSLDEWLSHAHVQVALDDSRANPVDLALGERALERRIDLRVEGFLQAMHTVGEAGVLYMTLGGMADPLARQLGYRVLPAPFTIEPIAAELWGRSVQTDGFARWLSKQAKAFCNKVDLGIASNRADIGGVSAS